MEDESSKGVGKAIIIFNKNKYVMKKLLLISKIIFITLLSFNLVFLFLLSTSVHIVPRQTYIIIGIQVLIFSILVVASVFLRKRFQKKNNVMENEVS